MLKKLIPNPIYLLRCITGVLICYVLYIKIPAYPFIWAVVSVVIALSPDNSNKQAYDRITANLMGCAVGLALFPLALPVWVGLSIGIALTIAISYALKKDAALRSALAALVIVLLNEQKTRQWYLPLERVVCVVAGCLVALLVTLGFSLMARWRWSRRS
jgi:uncharacterized membrane protein YgaE (UPF0421/DUF939 family)